MNLKNAIALVTGGGSGLGEATVREFAAARRQGRDSRSTVFARREGRRVARRKCALRRSRRRVRRPGDRRDRENSREVLPRFISP